MLFESLFLSLPKELWLVGTYEFIKRRHFKVNILLLMQLLSYIILFFKLLMHIIIIITRMWTNNFFIT